MCSTHYHFDPNQLKFGEGEASKTYVLCNHEEQEPPGFLDLKKSCQIVFSRALEFGSLGAVGKSLDFWGFSKELLPLFERCVVVFGMSLRKDQQPFQKGRFTVTTHSDVDSSLVFTSFGEQSVTKEVSEQIFRRFESKLQSRIQKGSSLEDCVVVLEESGVSQVFEEKKICHSD